VTLSARAAGDGTGPRRRLSGASNRGLRCTATPDYTATARRRTGLPTTRPTSTATPTGVPTASRDTETPALVKRERVAVDQVACMSSLFDLESLVGRLRTFVERHEQLKPEAAALLEQVLVRGEIERVIGRSRRGPESMRRGPEDRRKSESRTPEAPGTRCGRAKRRRRSRRGGPSGRCRS
jgi:hypothetical protein